MFRTVEPIGIFANDPLAMPEERDQTLWLCRDLKQPIEKVWPRLQHFG